MDCDKEEVEIVVNNEDDVDGDDKTDAWGTWLQTMNEISGQKYIMPTDKYALYYNMNHPKRGSAIIFNHEYFNNKSLPPRSGTNTDAQNLEVTLKNLGFNVTIYKDSTARELQYIIDKLCAADHSDEDCLMVIVLSHGEENTIFAKDLPYKPEILWTAFTADKCPTLAGKPKMFFIQACQGDKFDEGVALEKDAKDSSITLSYRIPTRADFLIAFSTVPGFYSWRNTQRGSWFMQAFCEVLNRTGTSLDLMTNITLINQKVAVDFESNSTIAHMHQRKQIPCVTSMLTRLVKFNPKPQ